MSTETNELMELRAKVDRLTSENAVLRETNAFLKGQMDRMTSANGCQQQGGQAKQQPWKPDPIGRHLSDAEVLTPPSY